MRRHNQFGCIERLGKWIHRNLKASGCKISAGAADDLARISSDIRSVCVERKTATRIVSNDGEVGRCNCSACNWIVDRYDNYCRRCGAEFAGTETEGCADRCSTRMI